MVHKIDRIREKLAAGKPIYGTHTACGGLVATQIYGEVGFDAVWIDTEHGAIDKRELQEALVAANTTDIVTFVRVPWNDKVLVKPVLDMGANGIIFPYVLNAKEAREAVESCLYPPHGVRGFGPQAAARYGAVDAMEYVTEYGKRIFKIIQIEHVEAVQNLDEILEVEGIDALIVGPMDLSGSVGLLAQPDHPEVMKLMDIVAEKCRAAKMPFGFSTGFNETTVKQWVDRGATLLFCDTDINYIFNGSTATLKNLKTVAGE